jgi:hypothetical protein
MMDEKVAKVNPEYPITPAQWQLIRNNRQGMLVSKSQADRWHLKAGDTLTIASPSAKKLDGSTSWTFKVAAVTPDMSIFGQGYMFGNYDYMDKARLLSDQGKTGQFRVKVRDASKTVEISQQIESRFANSSTPLQSLTEKVAFDVSTNTGMDIAAVDRDVALAGMFMVLFLTANGLAQAVRERFAEFATLKTIGFSDNGVIALVFCRSRYSLRAGRSAGHRSCGDRIQCHSTLPAAGSGPAHPHHECDGVRLGGAQRRAGGLYQRRLAGAASETDGHRNRSFGTLGYAAPDLDRLRLEFQKSEIALLAVDGDCGRLGRHHRCDAIHVVCGGGHAAGLLRVRRSQSRHRGHERRGAGRSKHHRPRPGALDRRRAGHRQG